MFAGVDENLIGLRSIARRPASGWSTWVTMLRGSNLTSPPGIQLTAQPHLNTHIGLSILRGAALSIRLLPPLECSRAEVGGCMCCEFDLHQTRSAANI